MERIELKPAVDLVRAAPGKVQQDKKETEPFQQLLNKSARQTGQTKKTKQDKQAAKDDDQVTAEDTDTAGVQEQETQDTEQTDAVLAQMQAAADMFSVMAQGLTEVQEAPAEEAAADAGPVAEIAAQNAQMPAGQPEAVTVQTAELPVEEGVVQAEPVMEQAAAETVQETPSDVTEEVSVPVQPAARQPEEPLYTEQTDEAVKSISGQEKEETRTDDSADNMYRQSAVSHDSMEYTGTENVQTVSSEQTPVHRMQTSEEELPIDLGRFLSATRTLEDGKELVIELEPASLGKLTLKLLYESGRAELSVISDNAKTLELLKSHSAHLGAILEEKTGETTVIYLESKGQPSEEGQEGHSGNSDNPAKDRQQEQKKKQDNADSFIQQLRLGLV